jgi:hypothetical protein
VHPKDDPGGCSGELLACEQVACQERTAIGLDEALDPELEACLRVTRSLLNEVCDGLTAWGVSIDHPAPDPRLVAALTARIGGGN